MNVPSSFRWTKDSYTKLNRMSLEDKKDWLKQNAITIRQSLGEAVPTIIFRQIGEKTYARLDEINANNEIKKVNIG